MEALARAVREAAQAMVDEAQKEDVPDFGIREAAVFWSKFALENLTGDLLAKALRVSEAMAEFSNELQDNSHAR